MLDNSIRNILIKKEPHEARIYGSGDFIILRYYDESCVYILTKYDQCRLEHPISSNEFLELSNLSNMKIVDMMASHQHDINRSFARYILMSCFEEFTKEEIATLPDWIFEELVMMKLQE